MEETFKTNQIDLAAFIALQPICEYLGTKLEGRTCYFLFTPKRNCLQVKEDFYRDGMIFVRPYMMAYKKLVEERRKLYSGKSRNNITK